MAYSRHSQFFLDMLEVFTFYHEIHRHLEYLTFSLFFYIEIFHWSDLVKLGIIKHGCFHFLETQHSIGFLKEAFNSTLYSFGTQV